ncbi:MAG: hypothetical protein ACR2JY_04330 [Chloroflexota bacterium]
MRASNYGRRTRRNPTGAMFIDKAGKFGPQGMKHPIRSWPGYDASRTDDGEPTRTERTARPAKLRPPKPTPPGEYDRFTVVQYKNFVIRQTADGSWLADRQRFNSLRQARAFVDDYRSEHGYPHADTRRNPAKRQRPAAQKGKPANARPGMLSFARGLFD